MNTPGLTIEEVFKTVRVNVASISGNTQIPWENSSLMGNYYFNQHESKKSTINSGEKENTISANARDVKKDIHENARSSISKGIRGVINTRIDLKFPRNYYDRIRVSTLGDSLLNVVVNPDSLFNRFTYGDTLFRVKSNTYTSYVDDNNRESEQFEIVKDDYTLDTAITLPGYYFSSGAAVIKPIYYSELDSLIDWIETLEQPKLLIEGHTDFAGNNDANQRLSEVRAEVISTYVVSNSELKKNQVQSVGLGGSNPLELSRTKEARMTNRRVVLKVFEKRKTLIILLKNYSKNSSYYRKNAFLKKRTNFDESFMKFFEKKMAIEPSTWENLSIEEFNSRFAKLNDNENSKILILLSGSYSLTDENKLMVNFRGSDFANPERRVYYDDLLETINNSKYRDILLMTNMFYISY